MDLEQNIQEKLKAESYGVFRLTLKEGFKFEWFLLHHNNQMPLVYGEIIAKYIGNKNRYEERTVTGIYREPEQLGERGFKLNMLENLKVFVPYEAIYSYRKLEDLPF